MDTLIGPSLPRVLVVDRPEDPGAVLQRALVALGHDVVAAHTGEEALTLLRRQRIAAMLLEVDLPDVNPTKFLPRVFEIEPAIGIVVTTTLNDGEGAAQCLQLGALDYLVKPVTAPRLAKAIERALRQRDARIADATARRSLGDEVARLSLELRRERAASEQLSVATLESLIFMLETRDRYLAGHSARVAQMAASIAAELRRSDDEIEATRIAGRLHDLGMICIGEGILSKRGPLTPDEFARVKQHVVIGSEILGTLPNLGLVGRFVRSHHERWDGAGYPDGLAGQAIPWGARIIGAAEIFDALTTSRPYRQEQPLDEAMALMRDLKGTVLDPEVFDALAAIVDRRSALVFIDGRDGARNPAIVSEAMAR